MTQTAQTTVSPSRLTDATLLKAAAGGDHAAFATLYRTHRQRVYRVAYGILLDRAEASDVVQDTFLRLHQVSGQWKPDALVSTWLYRVCVNQALSVRRKLTTFSRGVIRALAAPTPESTAVAGEALSIVETAMAELTLPQRTAVTLFLDAELPPVEIAALMGLTANATRVMLHRALEKMRARLRAHGIESAPLPDERTLLEEA